MVRGAISEILKSQLDPCQGRGGTLGAVAAALASGVGGGGHAGAWGLRAAWPQVLVGMGFAIPSAVVMSLPSWLTQPLPSFVRCGRTGTAACRLAQRARRPQRAQPLGAAQSLGI